MGTRIIRHHFVIIVSVSFLGIAAASPAETKPKAKQIASFPPLGPVNHNVMRLAPAASAQVDPRFPDLAVPDAPIAPNWNDLQASKYKRSTYITNRDCDIQDIDPDIVTTILQRLTAADLVPAARLRYFSWCERPDLAVTGWSGYVESIERTSKGLLVQVRISPKLAKAGSVAVATLDCFTEIYMFDKKNNLYFYEWKGSVEAHDSSLLSF